MSTTEQRLTALARGQEIRLGRAALKRRIATGEITAAEVILDPPPEAESWAVGELLSTQRYWGRARARKLLQRVMISADRPVGQLTDRGRRRLADALRTGGRG